MDVSAGKRWWDGKSLDTFLPLPDFFLVVAALNPFTSASKTIDGGFSFFDHPAVVGSSGADEVTAEAATSMLSEGGADITAVADTMDDDGALVARRVVNAPTGKRVAAGFGFWAGLRRVGANASAADQPDKSAGINLGSKELRDRYFAPGVAFELVSSAA